MNNEIMKELQEIEEMVAEARQHEEYKEKVFYVREGMLKLTGDVKKAILLSSLIGWTEHWLRTDNEVYKQIQEAAAAGDLETIKKLKKQIRQGWFYKSYEDMANDLLKMISKSTAERYCNEFEEKGFISSREPDAKATYRARWYKANIDKIREELNKLGYDLDHFKKPKTAYHPISQNGKSQNTGVSGDELGKPQQNSTSHFGKWTSQNGKRTSQNGKLLSYNTSFNETTSFIDNEQQQQEEVDQVVVVEVQQTIEKLFGVKLPEQQIKELIEYAKKKNANLMDMIQNTYDHFEAEKEEKGEEAEECKNPFGAIKYAIKIGGWFIPKKSKQLQPKEVSKLPKALLNAQDQQPKISEEELAERRKKLQEKYRLMEEELQKKMMAEMMS